MIKTIKQDYSIIINFCDKLKMDEIINAVTSLPAEIIEIDWSELESKKEIESRIQAEIEESRIQAEIGDGLRCLYKNYCDGVCMLLEFAGFKIDKYLTKRVGKSDYGELCEEEAKTYLDFFLKCEIEDKENILVKLDKNKLTEFYIDKHKAIFENCTILNKEKTLEKIKKLPSILKIVDENDLFYE